MDTELSIGGASRLGLVSKARIETKLNNTHHLRHLLQYKTSTKQSSNPERLDWESSISGHGYSSPVLATYNTKPTWMKLPCKQNTSSPPHIPLQLRRLAIPTVWFHLTHTHTHRHRHPSRTQNPQPASSEHANIGEYRECEDLWLS